MDCGFSIRPGGVKIHAVDVGQQVDAKRWIAELHHILGKFGIFDSPTSPNPNSRNTTIKRPTTG